MPLENDGPPDSDRPSGLCPRCEKQIAASSTSTHCRSTFDGGYIIGRGEANEPTFNERIHSADLPTLAIKAFLYLKSNGSVSTQSRSERQRGGTVAWRGFHWWPLAGARLHAAIPASIQACLQRRCSGAGCQLPSCSCRHGATQRSEAVAVDKWRSYGEHWPNRLNQSFVQRSTPSVAGGMGQGGTACRQCLARTTILLDTVAVSDAQQLIRLHSRASQLSLCPTLGN